MDTSESSQLSEIFSILEGDPTGIYNGVLICVQCHDSVLILQVLRSPDNLLPTQTN